MNTRRRLRGMVVADNSEKTVIVEITRAYRHPLYKKVIHDSRRMMVHDELDCQLGDFVQIIETKPISRRKRWTVEKVLKEQKETETAPPIVEPEQPEEPLQ